MLQAAKNTSESTELMKTVLDLDPPSGVLFGGSLRHKKIQKATNLDT